MNSNSLYSIIKEIKIGGIKAINAIIERKTSEQYYLDYKNVSLQDYSKRTGLEDKDRNILAKAISGFGNSEGGLLIWGVNTNTRGDTTPQIAPVCGISNFSNLINNSISRLTVPCHGSVENIVVIQNKELDMGYVVTVIPKYEGLPIQVSNDYKFYMRSGESFVGIPHAILSGMFGRRPNPGMAIHFLKDDRNIKVDGRELSFIIGILVENKGKGIARDTYLNLYGFSKGDRIRVSYEQMSENFEGNIYFWRGYYLISKPDLRIAPEQGLRVVNVTVSMIPPFEDVFELEILVGAEGQMPENTAISISTDEAK